MGQSASFPFEIGAEPDRGYASRHRGAYWQLYSGKRKVCGLLHCLDGLWCVVWVGQVVPME